MINFYLGISQKDLMHIKPLLLLLEKILLNLLIILKIFLRQNYQILILCYLDFMNQMSLIQF